MEVPVAHHLGAAQHICVERIRPVHILNRQSKVLKTEDTLPERCVVACCHSYYSFSTGTDEICAHQGEIAAQPTSLMKSRRLNRFEMHRFPLPGRQDSGLGEIKSGARCSADFHAAFDRFGSFA